MQSQPKAAFPPFSLQLCEAENSYQNLFPLSHSCQIRRKNAIFLTKRYPLFASALISHLLKPPAHGTGAATQSQFETTTGCCSFRNFLSFGHILGGSGEWQECPSLADARSSRSHPLPPGHEDHSTAEMSAHTFRSRMGCCVYKIHLLKRAGKSMQ